MTAPLQLATSAIILAFLLFGLVTLYRRYEKLSHIPGPFSASLTDLWRTYHLNADGFTAFCLALHKKYGPVVRVGPNTVYCSDATALPVIYSNHGEFPKADTYGPLRVPTALGYSVGSVLDMQDERQNAALKRGVGSAFTVKAILAYESDVDSTARELLGVIKAHPTFDLFQTMQFFQLDFLTKIAFSQSFGHLKERRDIWGMAGPTHNRMLHWTRWQALPTLEYYLYQHPLWCRLFKIRKSSNWATEALSQLNARSKSSRDLPPLTARKTDLLQKYVDAAEKHPEIKPSTIALMTTSTITAGFDTTAHVFTSTLFYLMRHPPVLEKVKEELLNVQMPDSIPAWESVNKLPYLDAVLKESMRCNSLMTLALERVVPPAGAEICGFTLPPGTIIGAQASVVHQDANVFGPDVETFRPERWLEASVEQRLAMERGSLGFGSGKRICLGRHIAELELKKMVPALICAFDMVLEDETADLKNADLANFPDPIMVRFVEKGCKE